MGNINADIANLASKGIILSPKRNPFHKFPLSALLGLLAAAAFLLQLADQGSENFQLDVVVVALQVAFIGSIAAYILCHPLNISEIWRHVTALGFACLFFFLSFFIVPQSLYLVVTGGVGVSLVSIAPCFYKASQEEVWWHIIHVLLASCLSLVVFVFWVSAFYSIEWMVQTLFALGVSLRPLRDIMPALGLALACLFFLGALPSTIPSLAGESNFLSPSSISEKSTKLPYSLSLPTFSNNGINEELEVYLRAIFDFLLVPILFISGLVLHIYAAIILLRQAFPDGQIGKIVTLYVCFVLTVRFLIYPFLTLGRLPSQIFCRIWALLLPVPLTLLLVAITLRSEQYGMTINRYYLYAGSASVIVIMLAQILPRWRHDIRLLPGVPVFFLIASIFGPWSVQNWVGFSQAQYLIRTYEKQGRLNFSTIQLYDETYHDIAQHVNLLDETGQLSRLLPYIEKNNRPASHFIAPPNSLPGNRPNYETFMLALGATSPSNANWETQEPGSLAQAFTLGNIYNNRGQAFDNDAYDTIIPYVFVSKAQMDLDVNFRQFATMRIDGDWLALHYRTVADRILLRELITLATANIADRTKMIQQVDLRSQDGRHIRLVPLEIHLDDEGNVKSLNLSLMLRKEEWPR